VHGTCCSVIPYISVNECKLLPLSVLMNAAGLLCDASTQSLQLSCPTEAQCRYLNELCTSAGLEFTFHAATPLVDLAVVRSMSNPTPYTRELPSHDPFSHAQFIDDARSTSTSGAVQSWHTTSGVTRRDAAAAAGSAALAVTHPANVLSTVNSSQVGTFYRQPVVSHVSGQSRL